MTTDKTVLEDIEKSLSVFDLSESIKDIFGKEPPSIKPSDNFNSYLKKCLETRILTPDEISYLYFLIISRKYTTLFPPLPYSFLKYAEEAVQDVRLYSFMIKHKVLIGHFKVNSKEVLFIAGPNPFGVKLVSSMIEKGEVRETLSYIAPFVFIEKFLSEFPYSPFSTGKGQETKHNRLLIQRERGLASEGEKLFARIMEEALSDRATDIHILPLEDDKGAVVDFRINMALVPKYRLRDTEYAQLRAFFLSSLKINDKPYSTSSAAKTFLTTGGQKIRYRFSSLPVLGEAFSESIKHSYVIRIHKDSSLINLDSLGMPIEVRTAVENAVMKRAGIIVVSGATGSGKSTTILSCLKFLKEKTRGAKKIITLEDPVEVVIDGVVQSEINEAAGYTFSKGLREALRHDPDVIFVGEVRDEDSAKLITQAAVTGHLVFTTVHAFSLEEIPQRFMSLGVDPLSLLGASLLFLEQVRIREYVPGSLDEVNEGGEVYLMERREIEEIKKYARDRVLFSVLPVTEKIKNAIYKEGMKAWRKIVRANRFPDIRTEILRLYEEKRISSQQFFEFFQYGVKNDRDQDADN